MSDGNGGTLTVRQEHQVDAVTMNRLLTKGDLSGLTAEQENAYYLARCEAAGIDPRTMPFGIVTAKDGKRSLYAFKSCTDQLTAKHGIKTHILDERTENNIRMVRVRAITRDGRETDDLGCVSIIGKSGEDLGNAMMKAVTKARRRAILSVCGLGMMDETEAETIKQADSVPASLPHPRRKSEAKPEEPTLTAQVVSEPTVDDINKKLEEAGLKDAETPSRTVDNSYEEVTVLKISKKARKDGKPGTSYGVLVKLPDQSEVWLNTFDDNDAATAETGKSTGEPMLIRRSPREWGGKTYWDLKGIEPCRV